MSLTIRCNAADFYFLDNNDLFVNTSTERLDKRRNQLLSTEALQAML